ncbi:MAG: hypothetical protein ACRETN_06975 [Nevskiales bacterium]
MPMRWVGRSFLVCSALWMSSALAAAECLPREPYQKLCECPGGTSYEMTCERWRTTNGTMCREETCADCECAAEPAPEDAEQTSPE